MFMENHQDQEKLQPSPVFRQANLWVKLKIPIEVQRLDLFKTHDHISKNSCHNTKKMASCRICRKAFDSEKGLAGHMRVHSRKAEEERLKLKPKKPLKKKTIKIKNLQEDDSHGIIKKKPVCVVCDRSFSSLKSLYGHMRCHPDRDWRGINPPKSPFFSRSSARKTDDTFEENDEKGCFKDWEVKARRGRQGKTLKSRNSEHLSLNELKRPVKNVKRRKRLNLCNLKPLEKVGPVHESKKMLDFDLNELPPSMSEDEKAGV
ncbi:C2H2-like zinc finger protein [Striga asiatica]|uniref:C2H2-like zinc finger protein n=1 Tax=Striga asiatica TaxID=4170 RepID=A0A5A7P1F7_STRAF|nr:C2H2-like zinc finger protein [Striga asiatica]